MESPISTIIVLFLSHRSVYLYIDEYSYTEQLRPVVVIEYNSSVHIVCNASVVRKKTHEKSSLNEIV